MADNDLISRSEAIEAMLKQKMPTPSVIRRVLMQVPGVDAVEVVRCEKCHFAKPYERGDGDTGYYCQHPQNTFRYGTNWERLYEPVKTKDDFCSYGERREENATD